MNELFEVFKFCVHYLQAIILKEVKSLRSLHAEIFPFLQRQLN